MSDWQPTASIRMLQTRARVLQKIRAFFIEHEVLEVQTPVLSHAGNTDPNIESFIIQEGAMDHGPVFLNTSPEFAMKRLLAAGSGAIYQVIPVFRREEQGSKHNSEFTLLEWYRTDFDHHALMGELNNLLRYVANDFIQLERSYFYSYREAFIEYADFDPFQASIELLAERVSKAGISVTGMDDATKDDWLNLVLSHIIEPALPLNSPVFIYDYPASQAALARISEQNPEIAERFELYINGIELANGFHELTDANEQLARFKHEQLVRREKNLQGIPFDNHLIEALKHGLPDCAGVALGLDRLIMILTASQHINDVLAFPFDRS